MNSGYWALYPPPKDAGIPCLPMDLIQDEISNLINYLSPSQEPPTVSEAHPVQEQKVEAATYRKVNGPPVILRCKRWEDFQTLAYQSQTLSFLYRETENTFQVDALKNNRVITYSGELPKPTSLLKKWLSKKLEISEDVILEGVLTVG